MALKKREFTPESGSVDTYELQSVGLEVCPYQQPTNRLGTFALMPPRLDISLKTNTTTLQFEHDLPVSEF